MSGRNEELLSAYFDGELTGDEKSLVEQRLADDVAARDMLDDMAEVSAWIRSLPRPAAPADLHGAVLSRVRAAATPVHVAAPASRPQRRWNIRRIAATSAALLAVVVIYRAWPVPLQRSAEVASGVPVPWSDGVVAPRFDGASVRTASLADDPTTVAFANSGQMLGELAKSLENGAIPVPGEVVHEVAQVGDQVLFVQYRVVDTQDLPGQVQVILTNNGISTVHNSPAAGQTIVDFDTDQNGQLEAIYLDAPVTNFNSAVAQITDLDQVTCVATNSVSFTAAATEAMPLAASAQSAPLEQPLGLSVVEPDASVPVQEGRFARELDGTVAESIADDSVNQSAAPAALPVPSDAQSPERQSADGVAETNSFSLQRDQPQSEERLRALYEAAPAGEERVAGEARAEELAGQSFDAYQVPVPVPEALWFKLQENEELLKEGEVDGRLPEQEQQPQTAAQQRRWSWYFAAPPLQGPPPAPDRIRAVILFVPDKSE